MFEEKNEVASPADREGTSQSPYPEFHGTREEWCLRVIDAVTPILAEYDIEMQGDREIRISIAKVKGNEGGYCVNSSASHDGRVNHIVISTRLEKPEHIVHTIVHEMMHAYDDCNSGHRGRWKRWANILQMQTKGWDSSPMLLDIIGRVLMKVGIPVEHRSTKTRAPKQRETSQIRYVCQVCAGFARVPRKAAIEGFLLFCGRCDEEMLSELDDFSAWRSRREERADRTRKEQKQQEQPKKPEPSTTADMDATIPPAIYPHREFFRSVVATRKSAWATEVMQWLDEVAKPSSVSRVSTIVPDVLRKHIKRLRQALHPDKHSDKSSEAIKSATEIAAYLNKIS